jgi:hypothetical protein
MYCAIRKCGIGGIECGEINITEITLPDLAVSVRSNPD